MVEKAPYGLKNAIRWHPGTSLASGHVVGIRARRWHNTNFAQTTKKTTFFQKNTLKILLFAKFAVPLHRVTNIT